MFLMRQSLEYSGMKGESPSERYKLLKVVVAMATCVITDNIKSPHLFLSSYFTDSTNLCVFNHSLTQRR